MEFLGKGLYLVVLLAIFVGPFALSFNKKIAFWRKWKYLPIPVLLTGAIFVAWDYFFTLWGVWSFNDSFVTGTYLFLLPVEEWLFFIIIPFTSLFIYECLLAYLPKDYFEVAARWFNLGIVILAIVMLVKHNDKIYTALFSLFVLFYLMQLILLRKPTYMGWFYCTFAISLLPMLLVYAVLTSAPVLMYDDTQNMGLRFFTIPAENFFYLFLLVLMNFSLYEWAKARY